MATVTLKVKPPLTPNFLTTEDGKVVAAYKLTDEQLEEVGKEWTKKLIERAQRNRRELE